MSALSKARTASEGAAHSRSTWALPRSARAAPAKAGRGRQAELA